MRDIRRAVTAMRRAGLETEALDLDVRLDTLLSSVVADVEFEPVQAACVAPPASEAAAAPLKTAA